MKRYDKRMLLLVIVAVIVLSAKSIWLDPVKPEDENTMRYSRYAVLAAPFQGGKMPPPEGFYTYRTVKVVQPSQEGKTVILEIDPATNRLTEVSLQGEYQARVRAYILYVLPAKHINVEGGVTDHGNTSQN